MKKYEFEFIKYNITLIVNFSNNDYLYIKKINQKKKYLISLHTYEPVHH